MPCVVTTCEKCGGQFQWNSDTQTMPDCPTCGHNSKRQAQQSDLGELVQEPGSGDPRLSSIAAAELGPAPIGRWIAALADADADVRATAVQALGALRDPRTVEPLIAALADDSAFVRQVAVVALGATKDSRAVVPLIAVAETPHRPCDASYREAAIKALGAIGDPRAVSVLLSLLGHYRPWKVVVDALKGCGKPAFDALVAEMSRSDDDARREAARALGDFGDPTAANALVQALGDKVPDVRCAAASALGELAAFQSIEPLVAALQDEGVCYEAAKALARIGGSEAVLSLRNALRHHKNRVRQNAASALGLVADPCAVEALVGALKDSDIGVRRVAVAAIEENATPRAIEALTAVVENRKEDRSVRILAIHAFKCHCQIASPRVVEALASALKHPESDVRLEAACALGGIADPRGTKPLAAALCDSDNGVRSAAMAALVKIGLPALEPLTAVLKKRWAKKTIRQAAALAVQRINEVAEKPTPRGSQTNETDAAVQYLSAIAFEVTTDGASLPKGAESAQQWDFLPRLNEGCRRAVRFGKDWWQNLDRQLAGQGFPGTAAVAFEDPFDQVLPGWFSLATIFDWHKMDSSYGIQVFQSFFSRVEPEGFRDRVVVHFGDLIQFDTLCGLLLRSRFVADLAYVARQFGPGFEAPGLLPHPIRFLRADQRDGHLIARIFALPLCAELRGSTVHVYQKAGVDWIVDAAVKGTGWRK